MSRKILFQFSANDRQLKDVGKIVRRVIKLLHPDLTYISRRSDGRVTWEWCDDVSNQAAPRHEDRDLELGLPPKVVDADMVSLGSALERMSVSSNGDKVVSPMSVHSGKSSDLSCKMSVHSCYLKSDRSRLEDSSSSGVSSDPSSLPNQSDWDEDTRRTAIETTADGQEPKERSTSNVNKVTQTLLTRISSEEAATTKQSSTEDAVDVLVALTKALSLKDIDRKRHEEEARKKRQETVNVDWKKDEEEARRKRLIKPLLVTEKAAMKCDRPEDINFAAKSDTVGQTRGKNNSGCKNKSGTVTSNRDIREKNL